MRTALILIARIVDIALVIGVAIIGILALVAGFIGVVAALALNNETNLLYALALGASSLVFFTLARILVF